MVATGAMRAGRSPLAYVPVEVNQSAAAVPLGLTARISGFAEAPAIAVTLALTGFPSDHHCAGIGGR